MVLRRYSDVLMILRSEMGHMHSKQIRREKVFNISKLTPYAVCRGGHRRIQFAPYVVKAKEHRMSKTRGTLETVQNSRNESAGK